MVAEQDGVSKRVAIYARLKFDAAKLMEVQVVGAREFVAERSGTVVTEYRDSAGKRTQFNKMMKDSQAGEFEEIVVWTMRRFCPSDEEARRYREELKYLGISVVPLIVPKVKEQPTTQADAWRTREGYEMPPASDLAPERYFIP